MDREWVESRPARFGVPMAKVKAKVLIVGCGDIGPGLAEVLIGEGHQVAGLKRKPLNKDLPRD